MLNSLNALRGSDKKFGILHSQFMSSSTKGITNSLQGKTKRTIKMEKQKTKPNRIIQVSKGIVGPRQPVLKTVKQKAIGDYPGMPKAYLDVARIYSSPRMIGPPICDELMALIEHMFTEEEATAVRHLKPFTRKTAAQVAAVEHRSVNEIRTILEHLGREKFVLLSMGELLSRRYAVMPIIPGTFEAVLITTSMDKLTDWQKRFAELFEQLYETGFMTDYLKLPTHAVRYLPVGQTIEAHPMALPSDRLEAIFDRYKTFAVFLCQCRMAEDIAGRGCGKPMENCIGFGEVVKVLANSGKVRLIDKKEAIEIKREAEAAGLVNWMINEESGKMGSSSCSCCGCCCHMMRTITEFNMPAMIAPPHFRPNFNLVTCDHCAKCARVCPMGAITVDMKGKTHAHQLERCIGCGQCVVACDKKHAVQMDAVADYKKPPGNYASLFARLTPNMLRTALSVWRSRVKS